MCLVVKLHSACIHKFKKNISCKIIEKIHILYPEHWIKKHKRNTCKDKESSSSKLSSQLSSLKAVCNKSHQRIKNYIKICCN